MKTFFIILNIIFIFVEPTKDTKAEISKSRQLQGDQLTSSPTTFLTDIPSNEPTSVQPTIQPTIQPTLTPTSLPTLRPCDICTSGQFYSNTKGFFGNIVGCTVCNQGYSCDGGCAQPKPCDIGMYADKYCSSTCTPCLIGTYTITDGTVSCSSCPSGYMCPTAVIKPLVCNQGTYSLSYSTICSPCQQGSYSPLAGMSACLPCPSGSFCSSAATNPVTCQNGYYSLSMSSVCTLCPSGSYSIGGQSQCTPCPPGYACAPVSATLTVCSNGSFSIGQQTVCTSCPPGYACPSTTSNYMTPCSSGYFSTGGKLSCLPCPSGFHCYDSQSLPVLCSPGTFSNGAQAICTPAAPGYYVPNAGMTQATICGVGHYSTGGASACSLCVPGYRCVPGSVSDSPLNSVCPIGGYCNPATNFTYCLPGTYGTQSAGISQEQACSSCPDGFLCPKAGTILPITCPVGGYCPLGSASIVGCSAGTFSQGQGQSLPSTCISCPGGSYCPFIGTSIPQLCPVNYFCPVGTSSYQLNPCPRGTHSVTTGLTSSSQCVICPPGSWCASGKVTLCSAGFYNPLTGGSTNSSCIPCEPGYACPSVGMYDLTVSCEPGYFCSRGSASAYAHPCPAGTYSDAINLVSASDCTSCPAQSACPLASTTAMIEQCKAGSFCPLGTALGNEPKCPPGTYSNITSLQSVDECFPCPNGKYCTGGSIVPSGLCSPGYFCPLRSTNSQEFPCLPGTYSNAVGLYDINQCQPCPKGHSCLVATTIPLPCAAGKYAPVGLNLSSLCLLCPSGCYCGSGASEPIECGMKYYSDVGASVCTICSAGHYCASNTTTATQMRTGGGTWLHSSDLAGVCFDGTYCGIGVGVVPDLTSFACPIAFYCPAGVQFPIPCPAGTYSGLMGLDSASQCTPTSAGYYSLKQSSSPSGKCDPGYYCPVSSTTATAVACPAGTYNSIYGGDSEHSCRDCPSGFYCGALATVTPSICPIGHFCPQATSEPLACTPGSYGNTTGLQLSSDCTSCDGGMHCNRYGLTRPSGLCSASFYCIEGSSSSTPGWNTGRNATSAGGVCFPGAYCPAGTVYPIFCPQGYYNPLHGSSSIQACIPCLQGQFCSQAGLSQPNGACSSGYYCDSAAASPTQHMTTSGYYTLAGAGYMTPCLAGTFNSNYGQSSCSPCPASYYCPNSSQVSYTLLCPKGNYCRTGSSIPIKCPVGTFSPNTGNSLLSDCQPCTPGSWCGQAGLSVVSGLCHEGFYCSGSAQSPYQYVQTSTGGPCTVGHYCLPGTAIPTPCPAGTYNSNTMATGNVTLAGYNYICTLCPSGRVCERTGLTAPSSLCPAGFWCVSGASSLIPVCSGMKCLHMYGVCPIGHYCPQATSTPIPCTSGTFMNHTGAVTCSSCPSGFYCDATVSTSQYLSCPQGFYCPYGTALDFQPCAAGTYGSQSGLRSLSDCTKCDIGTYNPSISSTSSDACLPCPAAYFCNHIGISNYSHWPCPVGHFCVEKTVISISCPEGSYRPTLYGAAVSDCLQCPVGRLCEGKGAFSTEACPSGRFCPAGSFASIPCPESFYCPANATAPILCPSAYFCSLGSSSPSPCIRGSYCPSRSSQPTLCPLGYKAASTSYNSTFILLDSVANACERCEAGFYGNDEARLNCFVGLKGYVYLGGTTTAHPSNITQDRGYVCPLGAYCPAKSISTILCPAGTFQPSLGQGDASSCQACPSGTYQNTAGSSTCLSCSASSFSDPGSIQCTCIGRNRAFQSGDGWCVCKPGYEFIDTITQVVSTDADGMYDCQPIVYPRCSSPQQRDSTGNCVNPDSYCASICGFGGGVLSPTTGLCACNEVVHLDDVCTSNCRASAVTMSCNRNPNGDSIIITDPITSQVESVALSSLNLLGSPTCQYSNSHIYSMSTANGTFTGIYGLGFAIASKSTRSVNRRLATIADFVYLSSSSSLPSAISFSGLGSSRRLQYTILLNTSTYPQIPKPLVCINQNDTIVFDIDDQNYPVYSKDSLINSNPNFDYSSFRNLQTLASQSRVLTNFSFTFVSSGIFEFKMSNSNANLIIIVTSPSVQCVTAGVFVEASQTNMIKSGVSSTNTLVLSPDWTLVIGLVVGVFLLINLVAGCLYYVRKNSWDIVSTSSQQSYRSKYNMRKQALRSTSGNTTNNNMSFAMRRSGSMVVPTDLDSFSPVGIATDDEDPLVAESIAVGGPQEPVSNKSWRVIPATQEFGADSNNDDGDGVDGKEMEEYFEEEDNRFSELFRHMQSNQKTLDHQYSSHSDKLHELQQTLKNEIKELKLLLTMKQPQNEPSSKPSQNSDSVQRSKVFHDQGVESFYTTAQGSIKATDDDKTSDTVADPLSAINSDKIIDELLDDTNLTIEQKDIVLDTRESDYKKLTALLDMETRIYEEFKHETETKKEKLFDTERVDDDDADSDVDDSRSHTGVSDLRSASKTKIRGIKSRVPKTSEHVIDQNSNSTLWKKKVQSVFDKVTKLGLSDIERENYCFEELFSNSNSSGFPDNTLQETIDRVQSRRHFSEMNALLSQLFTERTNSLQSGVETLNDKKLAECIHLVQSSAAENTDSETIHTRVAALEEKYREKQRVLEFDIITDLETSHEQNQLILRRQQLDETSDALAKYCTDDQQGRQMTSGSSDSSSFGFIEKEMNEYKDQLESAKNTRLEKFKVARVEIEKKLQQEHDVESVKVQEQILAEKKRKAERKLEWRQKELLWQQEALSKQQNSQSDELINFEDQRNIENEKRVTEELKEQERLVQKAKMHSRLKHRRSSRKLGNTWIHILGNSFNSLPPSESSAKQSTTTSSQIHCNTDVAVPVIVPSKPTGSFTRQFVSESSILKSSQLDTIDVKQNSPKERQHCDHNTDIISSIQAIETKLEKIEKLLATLDRLATTTSVPSIAKDDNTTSVVATISNPTSAMPFPSSTVNDELIPGSALELVDESVITIEERKKLEFGHRLARMIGLRGLKLVVASSISIDKKASSTSITTANTFSRHYKYMRDSNILVVHQEQLASSGNFELILIHALSHIIVNPFNLSDDADPSFVSEFYKNLRLLSQDLFRMSLATRDISIKDTNSTTAVTRSRPQIRKSTSFDSIFEGNKELKSHH